MKLSIVAAAFVMTMISSLAKAQENPVPFQTYYIYTEGIVPENKMCGEIRDEFYGKYEAVKLDKHTTNSFRYACGRNMDGKYHYYFELIVEPKTSDDHVWVQEYATAHKKISINRQTLKLLAVQAIDIDMQFWIWKFKLEEPGNPIDKYDHFDKLKSVHQKSYAGYLQLVFAAQEMMNLPTAKQSVDQLSELFPKESYYQFVNQKLPGMHSFAVTLRPSFKLVNKKEFSAMDIQTVGFSCLIKQNGPCSLD